MKDMGKVVLKENIKKRQNGKDALSKVGLPDDSKLWDTDRILQKKDGGTYDNLENVRGVNPIVHMKRHGTYKEREVEFHELKILIDAREQIRKLLNGSNNRLLAWQRGTDDMDEVTREWLGEQIKVIGDRLKDVDKRIVKHLKSMRHPIIKSAMGVKGVGPITIAYMLVYIDIRKAEYVSCMFSYIGMVKPSYDRYKKGEAGGGNKTLRTVLYTMADSMIKTRSIYRNVYDAEKAKLEKSKRLVKTRNTQGHLIECMWMDTKPSHRHGAGIRKIIKHFLADWWFVHRTLEGLPTPKYYVEEHLGHTDIIMPNERGWVFSY